MASSCPCLVLGLSGTCLVCSQVIVAGLLFNGPGSYLCSPWNGKEERERGGREGVAGAGRMGPSAQRITARAIPGSYPKHACKSCEEARVHGRHV
jgi:hypothetical protein